MLNARLIALTLPLALAPIACVSQTDSDYRGEVMAELHGIVTVPAALEAPGAMEIVVVWDFDNGDGDELLGQSAEVRGEFPARFSLSITEPPPELVLGAGDPTGNRGAIGYIAAVPKGRSIADAREGLALPAAVSGRYTVVYTEHAVLPETMAAVQLGGAMSAGYHLLEVIPAEVWTAEHPEALACDELSTDCDWGDDPSAAEWRAYEACEYAARKEAGCLFPESWQDRTVPAPDGFATEIELVLTDDVEVLDQGPNIH